MSPVRRTTPPTSSPCCPLRLVVWIAEAARIGAFAGGLEFDMAGERAVDGDGVIRPRFQIGDRGLADGGEVFPLQIRKLREVAEQLLERRAELILGISADGGIRELVFRFHAERGDGGLNGWHRSVLFGERLPDRARRLQAASR